MAIIHDKRAAAGEIEEFREFLFSFVPREIQTYWICLSHALSSTFNLASVSRARNTSPYALLAARSSQNLIARIGILIPTTKLVSLCHTMEMKRLRFLATLLHKFMEFYTETFLLL